MTRASASAWAALVGLQPAVCCVQVSHSLEYELLLAPDSRSELLLVEVAARLLHRDLPVWSPLGEAFDNQELDDVLKRRAEPAPSDREVQVPELGSLVEAQFFLSVRKTELSATTCTCASG